MFIKSLYDNTKKFWYSMYIVRRLLSNALSPAPSVAGLRACWSRVDVSFLSCNILSKFLGSSIYVILGLHVHPSTLIEVGVGASNEVYLPTRIYVRNYVRT